jgi:hypothetical protein
MNFSLQNELPFSFLNKLLNKFRSANELIISKNEFVFEGEKKEKSLTDQKDRVIKIAGKEKLANKLMGGYNKGKKGEDFLKEYVHGLEEMMFMTHHKVRQPVANILGMASLIDQHANSPDELKRIVKYMKQSALDLDAFTRELTTFISDLKQKGKDNE